MKKLLLMAGLLALLVGTAATPVSAKARAEEEGPHGGPTAFAAVGALCVAALPTEFRLRETPRSLHFRGSGEQLLGEIGTSAGWADLAGAGVAITFDERTVFAFDGTFAGEISADISVALTDGTVLQGEGDGLVSGHWDPAIAAVDGLFASVLDSQAQLNVTLRGDGLRVTADATAQFVPDTLGFCGPLTLDGKVRTTGEDDDD